MKYAFIMLSLKYFLSFFVAAYTIALYYDFMLHRKKIIDAWQLYILTLFVIIYFIFN